MIHVVIISPVLSADEKISPVSERIAQFVLYFRPVGFIVVGWVGLVNT